MAEIAQIIGKVQSVDLLSPDTTAGELLGGTKGNTHTLSLPHTDDLENEDSGISLVRGRGGGDSGDGGEGLREAAGEARKRRRMQVL